MLGFAWEETVKNTFVDIARLLNRFTAWAHTSVRSLLAEAREAKWSEIAPRWAWSFGGGLLRLVRGLVIFFTLFGALIAVVTFVVDLEDRQSERIFRAWQVVREFASRSEGGSSLREALQFLNREFDGSLCWFPVGWGSEKLTGNRRECLFPSKNRESLVGLRARRVDLTGIDLSGANLSGANLSGANLRGAILRHAILRNATLIAADLVSADLSGADFSGADLSANNFSRSDVRRALVGNRLFDFSRARISEAIGNGTFTCDGISAVLRNISPREPRERTDLSGAKLSGARLPGANLLGANLTRANLSGANLAGADLWCVDFTDAKLTGANLTGAKGADLSGTMLRPD